MKDNVKTNTHVSDIKRLHVITSVLCTFFLAAAYVFKAYFFSQLIIFLFLLFESRDVLKDGFSALSVFKPDRKAMLALGVFFSLLYCVSSFETKNPFVISATALVLAKICDFLEEKNFSRMDNYYGFADKCSTFVIFLTFMLTVITVMVNLFSGKPFFKVVNLAFLLPALMCSSVFEFFTLLFSVAAAKKATVDGAFFLTPSAVEKIGKVSEIIFDQRGIITESEYSLYDIYSIDNDKMRLLSVCAAIESPFAHPFAPAITEAAKSADVSSLAAENCFEICGKGVSATVCGDKYFLGNKKLMRDKRVLIPEAVVSMDFGMYTPLFVAKNGEFYGFLLLYSKVTDGAPQALEKIKELRVRRILIPEGERKDIENFFDILLPEREKVLQEFKKGAKIKAMTVTEKPVANAEVVAVMLGGATDSADVYFYSVKSVAAAFMIGKQSMLIARVATLLSMLLTIVLSLLAVFEIAFSPMLSILVISFPLILCVGVFRIGIPQFSSPEEDVMFGKVNYTMKINGMSCTHCSARVKTALESLRGVSADVSLDEKVARIKCPASMTAEKLEKAVTDVGFSVVSTERV